MKTKKQYRKNIDGSLFIELIIAVPVLFIVIGGIVDYGIALIDYQLAYHAAREGARTATIFRSPKTFTRPKCGITENKSVCIIPNSLTCVAYTKSEEIIHKNAFSPKNWKIESNLQSADYELNGYIPKIIEVKIKRDNSFKSCVFCYLTQIDKFLPIIQSRFLVEVDSSSTPPEESCQ